MAQKSLLNYFCPCSHIVVAQFDLATAQNSSDQNQQDNSSIVERIVERTEPVEELLVPVEAERDHMESMAHWARFEQAHKQRTAQVRSQDRN